MYDWYVMQDSQVMKIIKTLSLLTLLLVLSQGVSAQGISFLDNRLVADVLAQAKKENKMVFVDCYTTWCGPCKVLAGKVFPQKEVGDFFNPRFVSLKLDMEKGEGPEMGKKWDVGAYPTLIFMDSDGEVLFQLVGARDGKHLVDTVTYLLEHNKPSETALRYKKGERSSQLVADYIRELLQNRKNRTAEGVANDFVNNHQQALLSDTLAQQILCRYVQDPHNEGFLYAYQHRDQLTEAILEQLENKWRMFTKSYYIMGQGGGLSIDEAGMKAYHEFMKNHGVEKATEYYMQYKLPASFIMKDKRMMFECLEMSKGIDRIAGGQISMAINNLEKLELNNSEKQQLEALKKHYADKLINTQNR